jgi:hypothetical protein
MRLDVAVFRPEPSWPVPGPVPRILLSAMASLPSGGEQSDRDDYEYSTSDDDAEYSWIGWFCSRKGHEFLCEVQLLRNI